MAKTVPDIKTIITGEIGTYVNMGFRRIGEDSSESFYEVSLMRGQVRLHSHSKQQIYGIVMVLVFVTCLGVVGRQRA